MTVEPKILTRNYVNGSDDFVLSSNSDFAFRLYDGDRNAFWQSSGENSDITQASIEVDFKEGGNAVTREIDTLILLGHNLKNIRLQYWDGAAWQNAFVDFDEVLTTTVVSFNAVSTTKVRLLMLTTQTTNQEKMVGEFIVCESYITPTQEISSYDVSHREKAYEIMLADGSLHRTVVKNSLTRTDKYEARITIEYLTKAELSDFLSLKQSGQSFTWQPESVSRPEEVYQVNWFGQFKYRYVSTYKGAGFRLDLDIREI